MNLKGWGLSFLVVVALAPVMMTSADASSKSVIPKRMRGTWVAKPKYSGRPHSKRTMWLPKMRLVVGKKTAKWQMKGYLPAGAGYNHRVNRIKAFRYSKELITLKGQILFTKWNFLSRQGKKLVFGQQKGSDIWMTRVK